MKKNVIKYYSSKSNGFIYFEVKGKVYFKVNENDTAMLSSYSLPHCDSDLAGFRKAIKNPNKFIKLN